MCVLATTMALSLGFLFFCPQLKFSAVTQDQSATKEFYEPKDLQNGCNANCQCSDAYEPVCGNDKEITVRVYYLNLFFFFFGMPKVNFNFHMFHLLLNCFYSYSSTSTSALPGATTRLWSKTMSTLSLIAPAWTVVRLQCQVCAKLAKPATNATSSLSLLESCTSSILRLPSR